MNSTTWVIVLQEMIRIYLFMILIFRLSVACAQPNQHSFADARKLYNTGLYDSTINFSVYAILNDEQQPEPRFYRLIGYCYKELNRPAAGIKFLTAYLSNRNDSSNLLPVFSSLGELYSSIPNREDSAIKYFKKSIGVERDATERQAYYRDIINLYKKKDDYHNVQVWYGFFCRPRNHPSNFDLLNFGLAAYQAKNYFLSDSIFTAYQQEHPEEEFGYYWQARSKAAIDSSIKTGLAAPVYKSLVDLPDIDSTVNISLEHRLEGLNYLLVYYLKVRKDKSTASKFLERLLQLDPNNPDGRKYICLTVDHCR